MGPGNLHHSQAPNLSAVPDPSEILLELQTLPLKLSHVHLHRHTDLQSQKLPGFHPPLSTKVLSGPLDNAWDPPTPGPLKLDGADGRAPKKMVYRHEGAGQTGEGELS